MINSLTLAAVASVMEWPSGCLGDWSLEGSTPR